MRSRTRKAVFAFDTTVQAMKMEHVCLEAQLPGNSSPYPGDHGRMRHGLECAWNVKDEVKEGGRKSRSDGSGNLRSHVVLK